VKGNRMRATPLLIASALLFAAGPAAAARFDGTWTLVAETTRGHCGVINVDLAVAQGRISSTGGSFAFNPIRLGGRISSSGQARLTAVTGPRTADGTGRFNRFRGSGTWSGTGPSGLCSGVWNANRS
jgi:hypothetical protein